MPRTHEQDFINSFISAARACGNPDYAVKSLVNSKCKAKKFADVEYVSESGIYWAIEVKTHESPDFGNAVHKIFGELMKETGRIREDKLVRYALLLPSGGLELFGKRLLSVNKEKFEAFGKLIPVETVLHFDGEIIKGISWEELYGYKCNENSSNK